MDSPRAKLLRPALIALAYLVAYSLAALWARELTVTGGASPWFPGSGLALSLLLLRGPRYAPCWSSGS